MAGVHWHQCPSDWKASSFLFPWVRSSAWNSGTCNCSALYCPWPHKCWPWNLGWMPSRHQRSMCSLSSFWKHSDSLAVFQGFWRVWRCLFPQKMICGPSLWTSEMLVMLHIDLIQARDIWHWCWYTGDYSLQQFRHPSTAWADTLCNDTTISLQYPYQTLWSKCRCPRYR